jgi:GT2 family glycosyltransferase
MTEQTQTPNAWSSNDWPQEWIEVDPEIWRLRMSVVIPAHGRLEQLEVLLEALTQQTYPSELTEVLVVDDGSDPPLDPTLPDGLDVTVLRQERDGFGLARARNLGAFSSTGDVVVFLDADMIPETTWLQAHARPHHHHTPLAGIGPRTHVSRLEISLNEIQSGTPIQDLLADSDPQRPQWILDRWETTNDGRVGDDIWWGMSGGNFSVDRSLFVDVGGYDEAGFKEWGGEDNDLGYRIYVSGAFVVPIHQAMAWHLGPATNDSSDIEERRRRIRIRLASRVPFDALPRAAGVTFPVPDIAVNLGRVPTFEHGVKLVSQILSDAGDLVVRVRAESADSVDLDLLTDYFRSEPRAIIGVPAGSMDFAPISVRWMNDPWPAGLCSRLHASVGEGRSGVVRIVGELGTSSAWYTRLLRQAENNGMPESDAYADSSGLTVEGIQPVGASPSSWPLEVREWRSRAIEAELQLSEVYGRRALRLANSVGSLARARSIRELRDATRAIARASGLASSSKDEI